MRIIRSQKGAWKHFRVRLAERYGIHNMAHEEWLALRHQIVRGHKSSYVGRKSNSKTWWLIRYKKGVILALYCSKVNGFLSCLPTSKLTKALEGNQSIRNYLGLTEDSVMLRRHNEEKSKRQAALVRKQAEGTGEPESSSSGDPDSTEELVEILFQDGEE